MTDEPVDEYRRFGVHPIKRSRGEGRADEGRLPHIVEAIHKLFSFEQVDCEVRSAIRGRGIPSPPQPCRNNLSAFSITVCHVPRPAGEDLGGRRDAPA